MVSLRQGFYTERKKPILALGDHELSNLKAAGWEAMRCLNKDFTPRPFLFIIELDSRPTLLFR
jgi:hypothetical protein